MTKTKSVHNLIILDESGSMMPIKNAIITGFNEVVQTIKGAQQQFPEQKHTISFFSFNGLGHKQHHFMEPASDIREIDDRNYLPAALTPLLDAVGFACGKLQHSIKHQPDTNVLVTILTDGAENASVEFSTDSIKKLVENLEKEGWTFTYIGTDHNVAQMASTISIKNHLSFSKNERDIDLMFKKERFARMSYMKKIDKNEQLLDRSYFSDPEEDQEKS